MRQEHVLAILADADGPMTSGMVMRELCRRIPPEEVERSKYRAAKTNCIRELKQLARWSMTDTVPAPADWREIGGTTKMSYWWVITDEGRRYLRNALPEGLPVLGGE